MITGCQSTEDGYRLAEELSTVENTKDVPFALSKYSRIRVIRTAIVQVRPSPPLTLYHHSHPSPKPCADLTRCSSPLSSFAQGFAQLGSDLLVDFDLMMTIPFLGPFFLTMTQLSMPWILRFLYTPEF